MFPLQVPGGPELLILTFIFLLLGGVAVVVVGALLLVMRRSGSRNDDTESRIAELDRRVEALETAVGIDGSPEATARDQENESPGTDAGDDERSVKESGVDESGVENDPSDTGSN